MLVFLYTPTGKENERSTLCLGVLGDDDGKVPLPVIVEGAPVIPPATPGRGEQNQPRKDSFPAEIPLRMG